MTKPVKIRNMNLGSGAVKICVPLNSSTREELLREAAAAADHEPDIVEWRADGYDELLDPEEVTETLKKLHEVLGEIPVLFTIRTKAEGGPLEISHEAYEKVLLAAADSGQTDVMDVELFWEKEKKEVLISELKQREVPVLVSSHDFRKTDSAEKLVQRFMSMHATQADILKMAVMPQNFVDVAELLKATARVTEMTEKPVISMSMGALGMISRVCGEQSGSVLTFGTVGDASAPGQIPIEQLRNMMHILHK